MSRKATTSGVESTGKALPTGDVNSGGSGDGGMTEAMEQNGQVIVESNVFRLERVYQSCDSKGERK